MPSNQAALAVLTVLLAATIFAVDTFSPLGMATAVLYVVVVLLSSRFLNTRGLLLVALGCVALTVIGYLWAHSPNLSGTPLLRFLVSLAAIGTTTFLAVEDRSAVAALRASEEQWREVFEHNPVMYFMVDADGTVLSVNSFGAAQLGYAAAELVGKSVLEVFREEDRDFMRRNLEACVAAPGRSQSWEARKVRKDGSMLWVRENAKAVRRPGNRVIVLVACEDITERQRNENLLRRSRAYLADAQRLSHVGSLGWEAGSGSIFWSEETYRIFGYDPVESPSLDLVLARTHPEDRAAVRRTIEKARREHADFDHEFRLLMPDRTVRHVQLVIRFTRDSRGELEAGGAVMDVTEARAAEGRIQQIIDAVPATIWRARPDGTRDFLNARALQYVGMSLQEVLASGWGGQFHPDDFPAAYDNWLVGLARRKPVESVVRVRRYDGEYRWFLSRAVPLLDHAGEVVAWYGSDTDIDDRMQAEAALLKAQADLAHVTRVTTLGELSASIAHEVNQPLAAVVTNGEVSLRLLDRPAPDLAEIRDALQAIVSDGRRASDIIRRLRTLAMKAETQRLELDVNDLIGEVVPLVREQVLGRQVALRLELAAGLPPVLADRVQLQQVVINLVVNAVDAMSGVDGRPRQLLIRSGRHGDEEVLIAVSDSGAGIDPENARGIFEAFYTTKADGMGMGLSICRSIVESHGGAIWAAANQGPGATVQFTLPARTGPAA